MILARHQLLCPITAEQHLEEVYSNTRPVRSGAGDSKIERHWQAKVSAKVENLIEMIKATNSKTEQYLEEG